MATTAGKDLFVDTNVLVYLTVQAAPGHAAARVALDAARQSGNVLWLSRQILREYIATLTRQQPFSIPLPVTTVVTEVGRLMTTFRIAEDGPAVTTHLLSLLGQVSCTGKQVHDANIVATMPAHGIPKLLTNNIKDFTRFAPFITVIPLAPPPPPASPTSPIVPPPAPGVP